MKKIILILVVSMRLLGFEYVVEKHIRKDGFLNSQQCTINMSLIFKKEEAVCEGEWTILKSNEVKIIPERDSRGYFYSKIIGAKGGKITYRHSFKASNGKIINTEQVTILNGIDKFVPSFLSIPEECRSSSVRFSKGESFNLRKDFIIVRERGTIILPKFDQKTGKIINTVRRGTVYIVPIKSSVLWKRCVFAMSFSDS